MIEISIETDTLGIIKKSFGETPTVSLLCTRGFDTRPDCLKRLEDYILYIGGVTTPQNVYGFIARVQWETLLSDPIIRIVPGKRDADGFPRPDHFEVNFEVFYDDSPPKLTVKG